MKTSIHLLSLAGATLLAALFGLAGAARADVIAWDESVNGPFSSNGFAPTPITFVAGGNDILGSYGVAVADGPVDRDYFTFTVGAGSALAAIIVLPGTVAAGSASFIGIEAGPKITLPPDAIDATGLLGWRHTRPATDIGNDILPLIGNPDVAEGPGATGFAPPLGPGTYSVWLQDDDPGCGPSLCHYGFDFVVTKPALVPEPASSAGVLTGLALLAFVRRHRRQSRDVPA
jgi:hypothetical protein